MPELPDVTVYVEALQRTVQGRRVESVRIVSPFVLRTVDPPVSAAHGRLVRDVRRMGKRVVLGLEGDLFLVIHLMIAGRLYWRKSGSKAPLRTTNAVFVFEEGEMHFTEAGSKKRASLHVVSGEKALTSFDPGGVEPLEASDDELRQALMRENHTLKRALTDPRLVSGIGNAYSDEILHGAKLSPLQLTQNLTKPEIGRLIGAVRTTLAEWTDRLRAEVGDGFPTKVTAFRKGMAVHGRFSQPCPVCGDPVQRIRYAQNEANYCATCQTGGRLLKDRALSRLLRDDWPRSLEEMDRRMAGA